MVPFLLVSCCFKQFFASPVETENARLKLSLVIPTVAPITAANDTIEMLPVVTDKQLMNYHISQKKQYSSKSFAH